MTHSNRIRYVPLSMFNKLTRCAFPFSMHYGGNYGEELVANATLFANGTEVGYRILSGISMDVKFAAADYRDSFSLICFWF